MFSLRNSFGGLVGQNKVLAKTGKSLKISKKEAEL
jgi:hypothetical protein